MNPLLICPAARPAVPLLSTTTPLALTPVLGQTLVECWLEHLALRGAARVRLLVGDRPELVRALVADGTRWGMQAEILAEPRELAPAEARAKHCNDTDPASPVAPEDVLVMDHLPGMPGRPLFQSYQAWFDALLAWMPRALTPMRVGIRELHPGVWTGLCTRVAPGAELRAPCWIGSHVLIEADAVIGPAAVIEDRAWIEHGAEVADGVVGPETFVGGMCELKHSLAWGNALADLRDGTVVEVPDPFLLCALGNRRGHLGGQSWLSRVADTVLGRSPSSAATATPVGARPMNAG